MMWKKVTRWFLSFANQESAKTARSKKYPVTLIVFEKPDFRLELNNEWHERPMEDAFDFVNEPDREQINVSILKTRKLMSPEELRVSVQELIRIRKDAIAQLSCGRYRIISEKSPLDSNTTTAEFFGSDDQNHICFSAYFFGYPTKIVTLIYYKYECESPMAVKANSLLLVRSLSIKGI